MKTLYLTSSCANIIVDPESDFVGTLQDEDRYAIRSVYYIEDPVHVVYQYGEHKEELDAKKGDILLLFYSNDKNKYRLETVKAKRWAANIKNARKIEQKQKEEWAKRQAMGNDTPCCDCCEKCSDN